MKQNSLDLNNKKDLIKPVKVNLINNIPKIKYSKDNKKSKIIKSTTSSNPINNHIITHINNNNELNTHINNISSYIFINKSLLLSAYEKSILILFNNLKLYLKNDSTYFNELKDTFIKNVQNFYKKNKSEFSVVQNGCGNKKEEIKIDNYKNNKNESKNNSKSKSNFNLTFHKKNKSNVNKSISKIISGISNNSINKSNISTQISGNNKTRNLDSKIIDIKKTKNHKKSLYSLIRGNQQLMSTSPIKEVRKNNYKFSILNNFIEFNKNINIKTNISEFNPGTEQNGLSSNNQKTKSIKDKNIYKNFSFNKEPKNYNPNINTNINNNNKISKISNKTYDENNINNDLINCIKNSLDENLKGMFDFSYESFLNKETEIEVNY